MAKHRKNTNTEGQIKGQLPEFAVGMTTLMKGIKETGESVKKIVDETAAKNKK